MIQPLWRTVGRFLKKLKTELPYDSSIPLLGMYPESESEVTQLCQTLSDPVDGSLPGSSVHGFSRQEYWSGVPLPSLACTLRHVP